MLPVSPRPGRSGRLLPVADPMDTSGQVGKQENATGTREQKSPTCLSVQHRHHVTHPVEVIACPVSTVTH